MACLIAIELGGGTFAAILAALTCFFANVLMSFGAKVGPDMVGLWLWPLAALYVLRVAKGADARWWLAAGAAIGLSLESKYSAVFFACGAGGRARAHAGEANAGLSVVCGRRGAGPGDRVAQLSMAGVARLSDVGAAA